MIPLPYLSEFLFSITPPANLNQSRKAVSDQFDA